MKTILLNSGKTLRKYVEIACGAAMIGDPTAFIRHEGRIIWLVPGESVDFIEAPAP